MAYLRIVRAGPATRQESQGGQGAQEARLQEPEEPEDPCFDAFEREVDYVLRTLGRLGAKAHEVDDLCQEVYLAMRHTWERYDAGRPLRPYLAGLVFRVMMTYRRQGRRETPRPFLELVDPQLSPDTALAAKQDRFLLMSALERIPLARRTVLIMRDFDDIPMWDIAVSLSIPRFTAYSRLRKARRELAAAVHMLTERTPE